jgi:hypothetical protein
MRRRPGLNSVPDKISRARSAELRSGKAVPLVSSAQERPYGAGAGQGHASGAGTGQGYVSGSTSYQPGQVGRPEPGYVEEPSPGAIVGTVLAGTLMMVWGLTAFLAGLAMVLKGGFFVYHANYAYVGTIRGWGWAELGFGAIVFAAGLCVLLGMLWARIVGVVLAAIGAVGSFFTIPFYPIWGIALLAIDLFIIWALLRNGSRRQPAHRAG